MKKEFEIRIIESEGEIQKCLEVALVLRPHLDTTKWIDTIIEMRNFEKYNLVGIFNATRVVAFMGYRQMTTLHSGNIIYIDDLCTLDSYRGKGLGSQLLAYAKSIAIAINMDALVLDTGFENNTAQKLYLKNGFHLSAVHLHAYLK